METLAQAEQCNSRIIHLPHHWRVDNKSVRLRDLEHGHRNMRLCSGRTKVPVISLHLQAVLKEHARGLFTGCQLHLKTETFDALKSVVMPADKGSWDPPQRLATFGIDVIYAEELPSGVFEIRIRDSSTLRGYSVVVRGQVFDDA